MPVTNDDCKVYLLFNSPSSNNGTTVTVKATGTMLPFPLLAQHFRHRGDWATDKQRPIVPSTPCSSSYDNIHLRDHIHRNLLWGFR